MNMKILYHLSAPMYFTKQKVKPFHERSTGYAVRRGTQIPINAREVDIFKAPFVLIGRFS